MWDYVEHSQSVDLTDLSVDVEKLEPFYFAVGEISDVYKCHSKKLDRTVAVKAMRGFADVGAKGRFEQELVHLVRQWRTMNHPNVMACFGLERFGSSLGLVFPLCTGSIIQYLEMTPTAKPLYLLVQVASAVSFLHSRNFIHADIRGSNILMTSEGIPLLMDGGLSPIVGRSDDFTITTVSGPCRWQPPEVLDPPEDTIDSEEANSSSPFTKASDVYSLGMTILEVLTRKVPFNHRKYDTVVVLDIIHNNRPHRPDEADDQLWGIITTCWQSRPESRPPALLVECWLDLARFNDHVTNIT